MAEYDPPIYDVPVFNPAYFIDEDEITKSYLRANFLEFPIGQGLETLPDLRVENDKINLGLLSISSTDSVAIGHSATATGTEAISIGHNATSNGDEAVVVGHNSSGGEDAVVIGHNNTGEQDSVVLGHNNTCAENSVCLGHSSISSGENSIALGHSATTSTFDNSVAIGNGASAVGFSTSLGQGANASGGGSLSCGVGSSASGLRATAIGRNTQAIGQSSVALGDGATASADNVVALGNSSVKVGINESNPTEKLQIQDGNVYLGTLNTTRLVFGKGTANNFNGMRLKVSNEVELFSINATYLFAQDGVAYGTLWLDTSDGRLKKDIVPLQNGINVINQLNPVHYKKKMCSMKNCDDISGCEQMYSIEDGFIAQEIEKIPELEHSVSSPADSDVKGLNYNCILSYCVKAIQEQQEQIESLKTEIEKLKISA